MVGTLWPDQYYGVLTRRSTEECPVSSRARARTEPSHTSYHIVSRLDQGLRADRSRPENRQRVAKQTEDVNSCYFSP